MLNKFDKLIKNSYIEELYNTILIYYNKIATFFNYSVFNLLLVFFAIFIFIVIIKLIFAEFDKRSNVKYKNITVDNLKRMKWDSFEILVKKIFMSKGYSVSRIGGHGSDGGIDLIIKKKPYGKKSIIQCKRYTNTVSVSVIREMYAVGIHNKAEKVYIYTTANFSKPAYEFAKGKNIILIDGNAVLNEIKNSMSYNYYNKYFNH